VYNGVEERMKNVTYLSLKFSNEKIYLLNIISHNVVVYKNVSMTLKDRSLKVAVQGLDFWPTPYTYIHDIK
jgi:hypothetical protein